MYILGYPCQYWVTSSSLYRNWLLDTLGCKLSRPYHIISYLPIHPCIHVFVHLCVSLFVHLSLNLFVHPYVHLCVPPFVCPPVCLFIWSFMHWSVCLSIHPSLHLFVCPLTRPSISLSVLSPEFPLAAGHPATCHPPSIKMCKYISIWCIAKFSQVPAQLDWV